MYTLTTEHRNCNILV